MGQLLHYTFSKYLELVSILIHLLSVKQTSSASKIDCYTLNLIDFLSWITNPTSIIHSEFRNLGKWTLWSASTAFFQAFERDFPLKFYLFYSFSFIAVAIKVVKPCISSSWLDGTKVKSKCNRTRFRFLLSWSWSSSGLWSNWGFQTSNYWPSMFKICE